MISVSEINYLCVHKKLRSKRLAPVLIKEVTRQCNLKGVFQAIYTAGVVIPTPVSVCRYNHRLLNIPKLVNTRFCFVPRSMTLARMVRLNKLPPATALHGLREMEERDLVAVARLFTQYMGRFDMVPLYVVDEVRHQFLSGMGEGAVGSGGPGRRQRQVTFAYVVEVQLSLYTHAFIAAHPAHRTQKQGRSPISSRSTLYHLPSLAMQRTRRSRPLTYSTTPRTPGSAAATTRTRS